MDFMDGWSSVKPDLHLQEPDEVMQPTEKPQTTAEYVNLFGSELAIAFLLQDRDRIWNSKERVSKSRQYIRSMLKPLLDGEGDTLDESEAVIDIDGVENDTDYAFQLVLSECDGKLKEIEKKRLEIFLLGRVTGTQSATDAMFKALGLERPSSQFLDEFFWEGD